MNERLYILFRKTKALMLSLRFYVCWIFSVKQNRIAVCTFEGKGGFGCNPKYLAEELHRRNPSYEFIWLVNDMEKDFPDYIKKKKNTFWNRAYWLSTAKLWIGNYRTPYGTKKRTGQYYLNTNHYTVGIKSTGLLRGTGFSRMAYLVSKADSENMDALVIDSKWCDMIMPKSMLFEGTYLKTGAPRCDVLHGDRTEAKRKLREKHHLPQEAKIVMFAPTFREGARNGKRSVYSEAWTLDFLRLLETLERKFGGTWYVCTRVHPQLAPAFQEYKDERIAGKMFDESKADDMYEILAGVDAYITDYSSAAFEALLTKMPVFLYADDVEKYAQDRGSLMWNLVTDAHDSISNNKEFTPKLDVALPFPLATGNDELEKQIEDFSMEDYLKKIENYMETMGIVFDGKASAKLAEQIEKIMIGL